MSKTIVHLLRHGEVENPGGVLYGRLPDFHLSERGQQMAERLGEYTAEFDLVHLRCSPLERAQETMAPVARRRPNLEVVTDPRVIEAANLLEGQVISAESSQLYRPKNLWRLRNPLRPSWGEPYTEIVIRMRAAIRDAARAAEGHAALIVAHQLPIWMARCDAEGRRLVHDPRKRECALASLTSFTVVDGRVTQVDYAEPAKDLIPQRVKTRKFVAGA